MKMSSRELGLLWATSVVTLFGLTYLLAQPSVKVWKELRATQAETERKIQATERLMSQGPQWEAKLADFRNKLPQYPPDKDVTADLLIRIEKLASANGLTLPSRDVEKESQKGDMHELAVNCKWEGKLESLVRFLFALQNEDAILDTSQLTVTPSEKKVLRGSFTVYCSYSRTSSGNTVKKPELKGHDK
jgi:Tfp pilus assembly protein PilO